MASLFARITRRLLSARKAAPPIDRRQQAGLWIFYGIGDAERLRDRLCHVLRELPQSRVIADDPRPLTWPLHRRKGWRRILHTIEPGDVVFVVDPLALGPTWRKGNRTLEQLARLQARVVVILPDNSTVAITAETTAADLERIRTAAAEAFHRRRTCEALDAARAAGRWIGRPPLGWHSRFGVLTPDPVDLETIRWACRLYEQGRTLKSIAAELQRDGKRLRSGWPWDYRRLQIAFRFAAENGMTTKRRRRWIHRTCT